VLYSVSMSGHGADAAVIPIRTDHPTKRDCLIERRKLELQRDKARKMGKHVLFTNCALIQQNVGVSSAETEAQ
jgi:hypothetical protein